MNTESWRQANALFEQLLDVPRAEHGAWLDRECANQPGLRDEVERRLRADAEAAAEAFLDQPLTPPPASLADATTAHDGAPSAPTPPLPDRLGPYRILREIGRGGMGTVYLAERDDDAFQRPVAVKVITAGTESAEVTRKLAAERRILALLEHPNIARIYDGGAMEDGRPYFVMEHVVGVPIDQYCASHRPSIAQRVELLRQVCLAVAYAHRNLVVHQDLKPSNILVTEEGTAMLLDFGIAKVLDPEPNPSAEATAPWRRHLTLHYASPEQLRGRAVSTASDVYALGVLLFRLLTGVMPRSFEGLSPWEAEQQLESTEVPRPSTAIRRGAGDGSYPPRDRGGIAGRLKGDLDAIVLKALRTDPEARYRSADELADDLERYRRGFPVGARRGTLRYRAGKLLRRHRLAAALAALALALGLAFVASTLVSAKRLARGQARLLAEQAKQRETLDLLLGIFEDAGPYVAEGVALTVRDAVDRQAARLGGALTDQPEVRAAVLSTLGWIYLDLGALDPALDLHQRALDLRRALDPESAEVAESLDGVAAALRELGRLDRAEELSGAAVALHRRRPDDDPSRVLRGLNERAKLFCYRRDWRAADPPSAEALAMARGFDNADPEIAKAMAQRALVLSNLGQPEAAGELYRETAVLFAQRHGPDHPIFAALYNNLGKLEADAERYDSAADFWRRADAQYATAFGDDFYDRVVPLTSLGRVLARTGDHEGAERALRTALDVATRSPALGPEHEITYYGRPAVALAGLLADGDRCPEAVALLAPKVEGWARRSDGRVVTEARELLARCARPSPEIEGG